MPPRASVAVLKGQGIGGSINAASPPLLPSQGAFAIFFAVHVSAVFFAPIQDCDETFNYWEPSHYLNHGYGLQTWEYSPEYAIRSWFYILLHASIMWPVRFLPIKKDVEFYILRTVLAVVCAACETRLYSATRKSLSPRVAIFFLLAIIASPGTFHASVAYLPSTFAMYSVMLGMASFMDWTGGVRTAEGIMWFAIGAVIGWPFAGALVVPFVLEELFLSFINGQPADALIRITYGAVRSLLVLAAQVAVDTFFYRKFVIVPWNIVSYNVFSGQGRGPDIYGTEPWHFYLRNLSINFNLWFLLALLSLPLLLWQQFIRKQVNSSQNAIRGLVSLTPFYLWLVIFTVQPHKEERFMYPAYPALALNAAIALHVVLSNFGSTDPHGLASRIPALLKFAIVSTVMLGALSIGVLRTASLATGYSAALSVYSALQNPGVTAPGDNVCLGKEWYRFPTSYLLPDRVHAKFVKSEFSGLLPGEFNETVAGFGDFPGAWTSPSGMNDLNIEDLGKYVDISQCKFLVDSAFESSRPTLLEPDYISQTDVWEPLKCKPFLDTQSTGLMGRLFYLPDSTLIPVKLRRRWGKYCLLRRKDVKAKTSL